MRLDDLVLRYQQKIGSYDKRDWERQWEKSLEEEEINAFPLRNTKLKTDLIDLDLVRGSTFQKQKPKQTILQVLYLSILRYIFLPLFSKWWVKETSPTFFLLLLLLYFLQMINWAIFSLHAKEDENLIDLCEIFIPMGLSLLLCFTHSQIVATSVFPLKQNKRNRQNVNYSNKTREKSKRKKKWSRQRSASKVITLNEEKMKGYDSDDEQSVVMQKEEEKPHEQNESAPSLLRRRNVNWNLNNLNEIPISPRSTEDDGFESFKEEFSGKSSSGEDLRARVVQKEEESDTETLKNSERSTPVKMNRIVHSSDSEGDIDSPEVCSSNHLETTDGEYMIGVTSNSESDHCEEECYSDDDNVPLKILNSNDSSERVSVTLWTKHEAKKAEMNVFEISSAIINRVDSISETYDYLYIGLVFAVLLALTPAYCRLCDVSRDVNSTTIFELPKVIDEAFSFTSLLHVAFGQTFWVRTILVISTVQRLILAFLFFFLLAVAERTFKQRFLYSKLFSHLTSTRRARKSLIPHFRLNKVRHIKAWLSVRSYLKRLGPQRSVDLIVSTAFITTLTLLSFLSLEFLKESDNIHSQLNLEALVWACALGLYLLRFFTLGAKTNKKYRSISVLLTEQINLYVQIEKKPQKKEELNISCSVLKLAENLLKELDSPILISGLRANSYLYNIAKVVVLSALSGVLSEMLGFKLKLHKIKIK